MRSCTEDEGVTKVRDYVEAFAKGIAQKKTVQQNQRSSLP